MPKVLTTGSNVNCGHNGKVAIISNAKLTIDGKPVLVESSIANKSINGCTLGNNKCSVVALITAGKSIKLKAASEWIMLNNFKGLANNGSELSAAANQDKLTSG